MAENRKQTETEQLMEAISLQFAGTEIPDMLEMDPSQFHSMAFGHTMAIVDALVAIRDGQSWREFTPPQEIAADILKSIGMGASTDTQDS